MRRESRTTPAGDEGGTERMATIYRSGREAVLQGDGATARFHFMQLVAAFGENYPDAGAAYLAMAHRQLGDIAANLHQIAAAEGHYAGGLRVLAGMRARAAAADDPALVAGVDIQIAAVHAAQAALEPAPAPKPRGPGQPTAQETWLARMNAQQNDVILAWTRALGRI